MSPKHVFIIVIIVVIFIQLLIVIDLSRVQKMNLKKYQVKSKYPVYNLLDAKFKYAPSLCKIDHRNRKRVQVGRLEGKYRLHHHMFLEWIDKCSSKLKTRVFAFSRYQPSHRLTNPLQILRIAK